MSVEEIYRINKNIEEIKMRLDYIEDRLDTQECSLIHIREQMVESDIDFGLN